jgi:hypothetical protein
VNSDRVRTLHTKTIAVKEKNGKTDLMLKSSDLTDTETIRAAIRRTARETGVPCRMVVVDPYSNYCGDIREHSKHENRRVLMPIKRIANEEDVAFILIEHYRKGLGTDALNNVSGTQALGAVMRCSWGLFVDPDNDQNRILAAAKGNSLINPTAVSFTIEKPDGRVSVLDTEIPHNANYYTLRQIQAEQQAIRGSGRGRTNDKLKAAIDFLMRELSHGKQNRSELIEKAAEEDIAKRTLQRAKDELQLVVTSDGKYVLWGLPPDDNEVQNNECQK